MSVDNINVDDFEDMEEEQGTVVNVKMDSGDFGDFSIDDGDVIPSVKSDKSLTKNDDEDYFDDDEDVEVEEKVSTVKMDSGDFGDFSMGDDDIDEVKVKLSQAKETTKNLDSETVQSIIEGDFSSTEKMRLFSDRIIASMFGNKKIKRYAIDKLLSVTNPRLFRDENYILFKILYILRDKVRNINIDSEFVQMYLYRNRKIFVESKDYIDIGAFGDIDGQDDLGYIAGVIKHFKRLEGLEELSKEDFDLCFEKYLLEFKAIEAERTYEIASQILRDGVDRGRQRLIGFDDSYNYVKKRLSEIEGLVDMNAGSGFTTMKEIAMEEKAENKQSFKVSDFDMLDTLNKCYDGIWTGMFYQVIAPPKAGKTKFCTRICHTTLVKHHYNVTVWAQEGGSQAWTAQMRAIHFDYLYNRMSGNHLENRKVGISQDIIIKKKFPSKEFEELENVSKLDLINNAEYGKLDFIDRPFNVETFLDEIDTSVKSNNSKLVIIDYLQLIGSTGRLSERERVSEAYKKLLTYCKDNNVAVLTPGQYKQDAVDSLSEKKDTNFSEMRTAAGVSSEVFRTPDIIFALWATTEDLANEKMKILSVPCRFNKAFPQINIHADLAICEFADLNEDNSSTGGV